MRTLLWIFGTLLGRSWLIVCGVAIGLLARYYFPPTSTAKSTAIVDVKAKNYYDANEHLVQAKSADEANSRTQP